MALTQKQRDAVVPWVGRNNCCLCLPTLLANGEPAGTVKGCDNCPVTEGKRRDEVAIYELVRIIQNAS